MTVHPRVADRFHLLDGITSFDHAMSDPVLAERLHAFLQFREAAPPPSAATRPVDVPGPHGPVRVRVYEPLAYPPATSRPCLVWHHGGAFRMGDLDMPEADRVAREVAVRSDAVVVSVDYRLAVDGVHYPVPLDDCVAAVRWVHDNAAAELGVDPERISVGGASAGANLATGAALRLRDEDRWQPAALLAVYGVFHPRIPPARATEQALLDEIPSVLRFTPESTVDIATNYLGAPLSAATGYAMPALADLEGLCPNLLVSVEYDDLRPSGQAFAAALATAGVEVRHVVAQGLLHGFLNLPAEIEPIADVLDLMSATVSTLPSTARPVLVP